MENDINDIWAMRGLIESLTPLQRKALVELLPDPRFAKELTSSYYHGQAPHVQFPKLLCELDYCLGRKTACVSDAVARITAQWKDLNDHTRGFIKFTVQHAILTGRAGMDIDIAQWRTICELAD